MSSQPDPSNSNSGDQEKQGEIVKQLLAALQSASDRADRLSMFATYFGDPELVNHQAARYRAVTVAQVNAFARERLVHDNRASLLYVPRGDAVEVDV